VKTSWNSGMLCLLSMAVPPSGSGGGEQGAPGCGEAGAEEGEDAASGLSRGWCAGPSRGACSPASGVEAGFRVESSVKQAGGVRAIGEPLGLPPASARRVPARGPPRPQGVWKRRPSPPSPGPAAFRVGGQPGQACPQGGCAAAPPAWHTARTTPSAALLVPSAPARHPYRSPYPSYAPNLPRSLSTATRDRLID